MERFKITAQQAFIVLTRVSYRSNVKLRDIAEHLANTGEVITPEDSPTESRNPPIGPDDEEPLAQ